MDPLGHTVQSGSSPGHCSILEGYRQQPYRGSRLSGPSGRLQSTWRKHWMDRDGRRERSGQSLQRQHH